jgi:hypothetical protein
VEIALAHNYFCVPRHRSAQLRVRGGRIKKRFYKSYSVTQRQLHKFVFVNGAFGGLNHRMDDEIG